MKKCSCKCGCDTGFQSPYKAIECLRNHAGI